MPNYHTLNIQTPTYHFYYILDFHHITDTTLSVYDGVFQIINNLSLVICMFSCSFFSPHSYQQFSYSLYQGLWQKVYLNRVMRYSWSACVNSKTAPWDWQKRCYLRLYGDVIHFPETDYAQRGGRPRGDTQSLWPRQVNVDGMGREHGWRNPWMILSGKAGWVGQCTPWHVAPMTACDCLLNQDYSLYGNLLKVSQGAII